MGIHHFACLPLLSDYWTEVGQNAELYNAYTAIAQSDEYPTLDIAQKKIIDNALRDFRLSGVDLDAGRQKRFKDIEQQLSKLSSQFSDHLLDATNAWTKLIKDEDLPKDLSDYSSYNWNLMKAIFLSCSGSSPTIVKSLERYDQA